MDDLKKAYRVNVIIGLAMMASLVIYVVIVGLFEQGLVQQPRGEALPAATLDLVRYILLGLSAVVFILIRVVNKQVLNAEGEQGRRYDRQRSLPPGVAPEFGRLTTATVITYALCETPAIFGLALYFVGRSSTDFYLFLMFSLFCFARYFPRYNLWEEWYRRRQQKQGMKGR